MRLVQTFVTIVWLGSGLKRSEGKWKLVETDGEEAAADSTPSESEHAVAQTNNGDYAVPPTVPTPLPKGVTPKSSGDYSSQPKSGGDYSSQPKAQPKSSGDYATGSSGSCMCGDGTLMSGRSQEEGKMNNKVER